MTNPILKTKRLFFRTWTMADFPLASQLWGNALVTKFIDAKGKLTKEDVQSRLDQEIAHERDHRVQYWPIFLISSKEFIGCCGLRPYNLEKRVYEIGFHICPAFWGLGYASEAAHGVMKHAFKQLNARGIFAGHNPDNKASRSLLQKLGFHYTHDEYYEPTGLNHPSYMLTAYEYHCLP